MSEGEEPDIDPGWDEPALFDLGSPTHAHGRVRMGVDADARAAAERGDTLPAAQLAALRTLADQIDQLERQLRFPKSKPYDRVPLAGLIREFRELYPEVFLVTGKDDPFARAVESFLARDAGTAAGGAAVRDPAGPDA